MSETRQVSDDATRARKLPGMDDYGKEGGRREGMAGIRMQGIVSSRSSSRRMRDGMQTRTS